MIENKIRKVGLMWQYNFLRPLFWEEYYFWHWKALPLGWSIISKPDKDADESDYASMSKSKVRRHVK